MTKSGIKVIVYCVLVTVGIGLMLAGISALTWAGVGVVLFGTSYSCQWKQDTRIFRKWSAMLLAVAVVVLVKDAMRGSPFARRPDPLPYVIFLSAVWLYGVVSECRHWRKIRNGSHDA